MRATTITLGLVGLLFSGAFNVSLAQGTSAHSICAVARLRQDHSGMYTGGFFSNGAKTGAGIEVDCIRPIMTSTPQRARATKALPQVDPQVVQACRVRNPDFGMGGGPIVAFSLRAR